MFNLGDKVRILAPTINPENMETIDRIQLYNRFKIGTITHIEDGKAMISAEDKTLNGKGFIVNLPIRLTGLEKV